MKFYNPYLLPQSFHYQMSFLSATFPLLKLIKLSIINNVVDFKKAENCFLPVFQNYNNFLT